MKLHLGCGERYLDGYLNVDFPPEAHTVQRRSPADLHADILQLRYPCGSVDEIRLHHVFEHFTRPVACALLAAWHGWLRIGGTLHLEVPDFARTAGVILNTLATSTSKTVAMRHLFGSHEASWAVHCEGYTRELLKTQMETFGFDVFETRSNSWLGTHNFEMLARRTVVTVTTETIRARTRSYLQNFLLDNVQEAALLEIWMCIFEQQLQKNLPADG